MSAIRALREGNASQLATHAKATYLLSMLSLIVAVLGFGVMGTHQARAGRPDLKFTTPWILASVILYAVALLLNLLLVVPAMHRASGHLKASSPPSVSPQGSNHGYPAIAAGSGVVSFLLVVVVVLMVWRP